MRKYLVILKTGGFRIVSAHSLFDAIVKMSAENKIIKTIETMRG